MLEKINEYSAAIELTTLFILVMLLILIVTGWCMQPKKNAENCLPEREQEVPVVIKRKTDSFIVSGPWIRSRKRIFYRNI